MSLRRGTSLLDLLPQTSSLAGFLPDKIVERIGVLTVLDLRTMQSDEVIFYRGTLQSIADVLNIDIERYGVQMPGLTVGLPFRMAVRRGALGSGATQEAQPQDWKLDILVENARLRIPGLHPAVRVGGQGTTPLHLEPATSGGPVVITASGVIRVSGGGPKGTSVEVIDHPDPFDPQAPTGAVIRFSLDPPTAVFGSTHWGITADKFLYDASSTFTPAEIIARGQEESWEGVAFKELTLYTPSNAPFVGSLSISLRDVIFGSPTGLQGELSIEFGREFQTWIGNTAEFSRAASNPKQVFPQTGDPTTPTKRNVQVPAQAPGAQPLLVDVDFLFPQGQIEGQIPLGARWSFGDKSGRVAIGGTGPRGLAITNDSTFKYRLVVGDATNPLSSLEAELAEVTVTFKAQTTDTPPQIDAKLGTQTYKGVTSITGSIPGLAGIEFTARPGDDPEAQWAFSIGGTEAPGKGPSFKPGTLPKSDAEYDLILTSNKGKRRVRIKIMADGAALVGHRSDNDDTGVVLTTQTGPVTLQKTVRTYRQKNFNEEGELVSVETTTQTVVSGTNVNVPQGAVAKVTADPSGSPQDSEPVSRGFALFFPFDRPGENDSPGETESLLGAPVSESFALASDQEHIEAAWPLVGAYDDRQTVDAAIKAWKEKLPAPSGRKYLIVGRTDDLWLNGNFSQNTSKNNELAERRVTKASELLISKLGVSAADILTRIETQSGAFPGSAPARIASLTERLALPTARVKTAPGGAPVWNASWEAATNRAAARDDANRRPYRCAEIYVVDPSAPPDPDPGTPSTEKTEVSVTVSGKDGEPVVEQRDTTNTTPPVSFRLRARAKWDSPSVIQWADAIPTESELLLALKPTQIQLPRGTGTITVPQPPPSTGRTFYEAILRFAYDARTGTTEATGSLAVPDGTLKVTGDLLAGALAFGPPLMALVPPADTGSDILGEFVLFGGLLTLGAVIGGLLNPNSTAPNVGSVDFQRFELKYRWDGATQVQATVDYVTDLKVNINLPGGNRLKGGLKLRYKNVGLRFQDGGDLDGLGLVYENMSVEVQDPGTWEIGGQLGKLIRVAGSRSGSGSTWMEFDLEFALDLGVVRLEGATVRVTVLPDFGVELRGLKVRVDIANVLSGEGKVTLGEGGSLRALLALQIVPAKLGAYGALSIQEDFVFIEVGVLFPVGIPLGATGLALYGFMGRFVANGDRSFAAIPPEFNTGDLVQKELGWYATDPDQKYAKRSGQFALGLGAVIGTMPDAGNAFNAEGTFTIGFPDISVIFGVEAFFFTARKVVKEKGDPSKPTETLSIIGMTLVDSRGVSIGVRGKYVIPKVLDLTIPVSAFFPFAGGPGPTPPWFVRIGTDNIPPRTGQAVHGLLFPGTIERQGSAYLMFEEKGIKNLGGTGLNFDGFSIGFGATIEVSWDADPFRLAGSVSAVVGVGTKPLLLAGRLSVHGELSLVVVTVTVDGHVDFKIQGDKASFRGEICGGIDCWLFEISGCVDVEFGDEFDTTPPPPDSPVQGIDLCDHRAAVKAKLEAGDGSGELPVVWPDTLPVIHFAHPMDDRVRPDTTATFRIDVAEPSPTPLFAGSTELKYAYRLNSVDLYRLNPGGNPANDADWTRIGGRHPAAWWFPTHRAAVITGNDDADIAPSAEEGRDLGLFWWHPSPWARWFGEDGGAGLPGDPARTWTVTCDPAPAVAPACAFGTDARPSGVQQVNIVSRPQPPTAFPGPFSVSAGLDARINVGLLLSVFLPFGFAFEPSVDVSISPPFVTDGFTLVGAWRFPALFREGRFALTLPVELAISPELIAPVLTLEACVAAVRDPGGGGPAPDPGVGQEICDILTREESARVVRGMATATGVLIRAEQAAQLLEVVADGTSSGVGLPAGGLRVVLPEAVSLLTLSLVLAQGGATIQALDANGNVVAAASVRGPGPRTVELSGDGITSARAVPSSGADAPSGGLGTSGGAGSGSSCGCIVCRRGGGAGGHDLGGSGGGSTRSHITKICRTKVGPPGGIDPGLLEPVSANSLPVVVGVLPSGEEVPFLATPIAGLPAGSPCQRVEYRPSNDQAEWSFLRVKPWDLGTIKLLGLCGTSAVAVQKRAEDQAVRDSLLNAVTTLGGGGPSAAPARSVVLDPERTYQIRVRWQYQAWQPARQGQQPPAVPPASKWAGGTTERFTFRTAAWGPVAEAPGAEGMGVNPAEGGPSFDERSFDARGLARFLTFTVPADGAPPHFLSDALGFGFMVDHLRGLADKYAATLEVRVLRTDPAAGSLNGVPQHVPGTPHPLDVATGTQWQNDTTTWFASEERIRLGVGGCFLSSPRFGSSSVTVTAALEPFAEYDLLLVAVQDDEEVVVARSHFETSRYQNPNQLMAALGLPSGDPAVHPPQDFVLSGSVVTLTPAVGDGALDDALRSLGLDPWPVPTQPRATLIRERPAASTDPWKVVGLLLESDEPIHRRGIPTQAKDEPLDLPDWFRVVEVQIPAFDASGAVVSTAVLNQQIRNASGTRVLVFAATPRPITGGVNYQLSVLTSDRGAPPTFGLAPLYPAPLVAIEEGEA